MNLNKLKPAWAYFKQIQNLETITRQEILDLIETQELTTYQPTRFADILVNSIVLSTILFLYQSC